MCTFFCIINKVRSLVASALGAPRSQKSSRVHPSAFFCARIALCLPLKKDAHNTEESRWLFSPWNLIFQPERARNVARGESRKRRRVTAL